MGEGFGAICRECSAHFRVHDGSGMASMPFRCDGCGKEWWWEFGDGGPVGDANPPPCECGGRFTEEAPPRCPKCRSKLLARDPAAYGIIYD